MFVAIYFDLPDISDSDTIFYCSQKIILLIKFQILD
jgi:hypothetical protein